MLKKIFRARNQAVIWGTIFSCLIIFSSFALASQDELNELHKAIKAKGKKWFAGETSVSKLPHKERIGRLGAIIGPFMEEEKASAIPPQSLYSAQSSLSAHFDWRNYNGYNYVTPVRDQKNCGSCWAFATAAALESQILIGENTPGVDLNVAEQILVSCSSAGNCGGGYISMASSYIRDTGLPVESCYPYTATNGSCPNACPNWQNNTYQVVNWHYAATTSPTVEALRNALYQYGPLVTTMQVYSDFYYYVGGVYSHTSGTYQGGHAVLIVGYDDAGQFFTAKNSWGTSWGESGFFRIAYAELNTLVDFGNYTIAYEGSQPAPPPEAASITVTTPNGGESWPSGTTQTIRWTYTGNPGPYVKIELFKASTLYMTITPSTPLGNSGSGSYNWAIPSAQAPGTDYRIRVTSTIDGQYLDVSNSYFTITALPPPAASIRVSFPNGGESLRMGTTQTIRWTYSGDPGANVKIELLKYGGLYMTIASSVSVGSSGNGSYAWTIPTSLESSKKYKVRVTSTANGAATDTSDRYFTIMK